MTNAGHTSTTISSTFSSLPFIFITLLGSLGNCFIFLAMYRVKSLRTTSNRFIFSLAVTDLAVCLLCVPFTAIAVLFNGKWIFSDVTCQIIAYMNHVFCEASMMTLFSFSVYRYYVVTNTSHIPNISRYVMLSILFIWFLSVIFSLPPLVGWGSYAYHFDKATCSLDWVADPTFSVPLFIIVFGIPVNIMIVAYVKMFKFIKEKNLNLGRSADKNIMNLPHTGVDSMITESCQAEDVCPFPDTVRSKKRKQEICGQTSFDNGGFTLDQAGEDVEKEVDKKHSISDIHKITVISSNSHINRIDCEPDISKEVIANESLISVSDSDTSAEEEIKNGKALSLGDSQSKLAGVSVQKTYISEDTFALHEEVGRSKEKEDNSRCTNGKSGIHPAVCVETSNDYKHVKKHTQLNRSSCTPKVLPLQFNGNFESKSHKRAWMLNTPCSLVIGPTDLNGEGRNDILQKTMLRKVKSSQREAKLVRTLLVTVIIFLICWSPYGVDSLLMALGVRSQRPVQLQRFIAWLAYFNSCCNFAIYAWFNDQFNKAFWDLLKCCFRNVCRKCFANNSI